MTVFLFGPYAVAVDKTDREVKVGVATVKGTENEDIREAVTKAVILSEVCGSVTLDVRGIRELMNADYKYTVDNLLQIMEMPLTQRRKLYRQLVEKNKRGKETNNG